MEILFLILIGGVIYYLLFRKNDGRTNIPINTMEKRASLSANQHNVEIIELSNHIDEMRALEKENRFLWFKTEDEKKWEAGREGEDIALSKVYKQLSRLNGKWKVITGYCNNKGETDMLIIGETALLAMEIKNYSGVINCNGDEWFRDKYDKYGNLVEEDIPMRSKGRSPSMQVNEVAISLLNFLSRRGEQPKLFTGVLFTHRNSNLNALRNQTVDIIGTIKELNIPSLFSNLSDSGRRYDVDKITNLIIQDHNYHIERKKKRSNHR